MSEQGKVIKKIPGGKLVRVDVTYSESIEQVKITGDFFLHPEELLPDLESIFRGAKLPLQSHVLTRQVQAVLEGSQATLIGLTPEDLVEVIGEAVQ